VSVFPIFLAIHHFLFNTSQDTTSKHPSIQQPSQDHATQHNMLPKHIITAVIAVMAHGATAAFNNSCSWWWVEAQPVTLTGDCVDSTSATRRRVVSNLDLNHCIGVDLTANAMIWQPE
jgi:hypothetical protein